MKIRVLDKLKEILRQHHRDDKDFYMLYLEALRYIASVLDNMDMPVPYDNIEVTSIGLRVKNIISLDQPFRVVFYIDAEMNVRIYYTDIINDSLGLTIIRNQAVMQYLENTLSDLIGVDVVVEHNNIAFSLEECRKKGCSALDAIETILIVINDIIKTISNEIIEQAAKSLGSRIAAAIVNYKL